MQFENRLRCQFLITVQSVGRRMRRHRALPRRKWGSCLRAPSVGFRCTPETTMSPAGERKILYTQTGVVYQIRVCEYGKYDIRDLTLQNFDRLVDMKMKYDPVRRRILSRTLMFSIGQFSTNIQIPS